MLVYLIVITSLASVAAMQGTSLLQVSASRQRAPDLGWCWNLIPSDTEVFLLHIGKAAGCSTVADLSKIVDRNNIWSNQGCLSWAHSMQDSWHVRFNVTATMLRKPEDLVLSMYYQCKTSGGKGSIMWNNMAKLGFAPDQPGYNMPDTFQEWVRAWAASWPVSWPSDPSTTGTMEGSWGHDEFHCNDPRNMQSRILTCEDEIWSRPDTYNATQAVSAMESIDLVGIVEAYHESICLFAVRLRHHLPSHCNCQDANAWNSFQATHVDHGHSYTETVEEQPPAVRRDLQVLTGADKLVYKAAVERFVQQMDSLEHEFGVKVLCQQQQQMLLRKIME